MCGIFGFVITNKEWKRDKVDSLTKSLFKLSESRGKDSSGLAILNSNKIKVLKKSLPASKLIKTKDYKTLLSESTSIKAVIGHARMETDGSFGLSYNNQPVVKDGCVTVHNGIIVNHKKLWQEFPSTKREYEVDTEIINSLLRYHLSKKYNPIEAAKKTLNLLEGSFTIGTLFEDIDYLLLATNTGSLHTVENLDQNLFMFTSEEYFVRTLLRSEFSNRSESFRIKKIKPRNGLFLDLKTLDKFPFSLDDSNDKTIRDVEQHKREIVVEKDKVLPTKNPILISNTKNTKKLEEIINKEYNNNKIKILKLRRCTKCILPETMPFIKFDKNGVCNYCHSYEKMTVKGERRLREEIKEYKVRKGRPNCIVAFSGGRDSSYALHYVKNVLKLDPLAFSYDWGMITDLGRRNQARMTGQLGAEHILLSADIQRKRKYIRQNILAWLKKPDIGMVPLFMAGDKHYFYYLNRLRKQTGIDLVIYADNALEKSDFKYGFANTYTPPGLGKTYDIGTSNTLRLLWYYSKQYLTNPRYINMSLIDTFTAYISSYFIPKDYVYFYRFIRWDEKKIIKTLLEKYDWEIAKDTKTTWRIGDGTAAFYNYIYYTVTGFTENDTFRSNQIREGQLSRSEALEKSAIDNTPRIESTLWYCNTIDFDALNAIKIINNMSKLY